jgi:hypothetical protein
MKILALEHELPNHHPGEFQPLLAAEARRVWQLYQDGIRREIYFREDQSAAVLVLEAASEAACRTILATLPLVQAGLIDFELIPLAFYPGFPRLFAPEALL